MIPFTWHLWNDKILETEDSLVLASSGDKGAREGERKAKGAVDVKGEHEESYRLDLLIIWLQCSLAKPTQLIQLYGIKRTRSHTHWYKVWVPRWIVFELNILIVTFHNGSAKCFLWGKLGKIYKKPLCIISITSFNPIVTSIQISILEK